MKQDQTGADSAAAYKTQLRQSARHWGRHWSRHWSRHWPRYWPHDWSRYWPRRWGLDWRHWLIAPQMLAIAMAVLFVPMAAAAQEPSLSFVKYSAEWQVAELEPGPDGFVTVNGNVVFISGPLSTGISKSFELKIIEAVVYAGDELPIILLLNSRGGLDVEAERIKAVIGIYQKSGVRFEARVNYRQVCGVLCQSVAAQANEQRIDVGAILDDVRPRQP